MFAHDPQTGESGARAVTAIWPHEDTLVEFEVGDATVTTTGGHEFWNVTDNAWQETQHIDAGDLLLTADGAMVEAGTLLWGTAHVAPAFDLTIDEIHTYHVTAGDQSVLVHNTGETCQGLAIRGARADLDVPEQSYFDIVDADPDTTVIGTGDVAVRSILNLDGRSPDFRTYNSATDSFTISEVKASFGTTGADASTAIAQLTNALDGLAATGNRGRLSRLELVIPEGGGIDGAFSVRNGLLVRDVQEGISDVTIDGIVVHVVEAPLQRPPG